MTPIKERHLMLIRELNNPDSPMQPISTEKFDFLEEKIGTNQLALDLKLFD
ncbi:MAG: hypothetical protein ACL7AY_14435 [Candidatus Arsenophonus phytopathogenicus]